MLWYKLKEGKEGDLVAFRNGVVVLPQNLPSTARAGQWVRFDDMQTTRTGRAVLAWVLEDPVPAVVDAEGFEEAQEKWEEIEAQAARAEV